MLVVIVFVLGVVDCIQVADQAGEDSYISALRKSHVDVESLSGEWSFTPCGRGLEVRFHRAEIQLR